METRLEFVKEEERLLGLLSAVRSKLKELTIKERCLMYGVSIGDTVEFMDGRKLKIGVLKKIDGYFPEVLLFKKDGTLGLRTTSVYLRDTLKKHV